MGRTSDARDRMLDAARDLIWKQGYSAVTVEAICDEAGVRKGSFYYFFKSKAELAEEAFATLWECFRPRLDQIFSPGTPPLERLQNYFNHLHEQQAELKAKYGCVVGCPFGALGSELTQSQEPISAYSRNVLLCYRKYFETALRDAQAAGDLVLPDIPAAAQRLFAYVEGCIFQARIQNDLAPLHGLMQGALVVIGATSIKAKRAQRLPVATT